MAFRVAVSLDDKSPVGVMTFEVVPRIGEWISFQQAGQFRAAEVIHVIHADASVEGSERTYIVIRFDPAG